MKKQKKYRPNFDLENDARKRAGSRNIMVAGLDEVGVGAISGPVIAAAVVLNGDESWLGGLDDSKRLTHKKRQVLHDLIVDEAPAFGIGYATHEEIDEVGIASARRRAIIRAFKDCKEKIGRDDLIAVVDDRRLAWIRSDLGGRASIFADKADQRSYCVVPGSRVLTYDLKWVPVETLNIGDEVFSFDEFSTGQGTNRRKWCKGIVTNTCINIEPVYEIRLSNDDILVSTGEHPWLAPISRSNVWRRTDFLGIRSTSGGHPSHLIKLIEPWEEDHTYEGGFLSAAFDGEGCIGRNKRSELSFAQNKNALWFKVLEFLDKKDISVYTSKPHLNKGLMVARIHGQQNILQFLGRFRPPRLLCNFEKLEGIQVRAANRKVKIKSITPLGLRPVVALSVDTKTYIVEGYGAHNSVAAASIVAKTVRDRYMKRMAGMWKNYEFARNVGYGTPSHLKALKEYGPCPLHRRSFAPLRGQDIIYTGVKGCLK